MNAHKLPSVAEPEIFLSAAAALRSRKSELELRILLLYEKMSYLPETFFVINFLISTGTGSVPGYHTKKIKLKEFSIFAFFIKHDFFLINFLSL